MRWNRKSCAGPRRDLRGELHRAGAGADHRDARAVDGRVVVPLRGVERHAREGVEPGDLGEVRPVELADRAHHRVGDQRLLLAVRTPAPRRTTSPTSSSQVAERTSVLEADVVEQPEVAREVAEVAVEDFLVRVVQRPVVTLRERVAVVVVGVVDPAPRIGVLVPGAAHVGVLLDHLELDARLLQPVRGEQSRHPRADHDDPEVAVGIDIVLPPLRAPPVVAAERELLVEQRHVVVHVGAADRVLHDAQQVVARRRRRGTAAAVAVAGRAPRARVPARRPAARRSCRPAGGRAGWDRDAGRRAAATGRR